MANLPSPESQPLAQQQPDLVWKKADNWTRVADGNTTWVNLSRFPHSLVDKIRVPFKTAGRTALVLGVLAGTQHIAPPVASADNNTPPHFQLGFKIIDDQIPTQVGQPLDNEAYAANGDSLQHTTGGLLAWRKADNWTAFTDGYRSWVNGPNGLQNRLNTQRFAFEANPENLPIVGNGSVAIPIRGGPASVETPKQPTPDITPALHDTTVDNVPIRDYKQEDWPKVRSIVGNSMKNDRPLTQADFTPFLNNPNIQQIAGDQLEKITLVLGNLGDAQKAFSYVKYLGILVTSSDRVGISAPDGGIRLLPGVFFGMPGYEQQRQRGTEDLLPLKEYRTQEIYQMCVEAKVPLSVAGRIGDRAGLYIQSILVSRVDGITNDYKQKIMSYYQALAFDPNYQEFVYN